VLTWALTLSLDAQALAPRAAGSAPLTIDLPADMLAPPLDLDDATRDALAERNHADAAARLLAVGTADLAGHQVDDHAFLTAWSLVHAGRAGEGEPYIDILRGTEGIPLDYVQLTLAEILLALGEPLEAAGELAAIDGDSVLGARAAVVRAETLRELGRTAEARGVYEELLARPDPSEGSDLALLALAKLEGVGSERSYTLLRRAWSHYSTSDVASEVDQLLEGYGRKATWQEITPRAEKQMNGWGFSTAVKMLEPYVGQVTEPSPEACRFWFVYGRSHFRQNNLTKSASHLGPWGRSCRGVDDERGPKMLYLTGKAEERKKAWATAATHYAAIAELYPDHSYADDGLALAGIATQEAGDLAGARALWADQVARYPDGDLAGEGFWRLAWGAYLEGDTESALSWVGRALEELPIKVDPVHYRAAMYWQARWQVWPDVTQPALSVTDPVAVARAVEGFTRLVTDHPYSYYAQQAANRLRVLAPEVLEGLQRPVVTDEPWNVRVDFLREPAVEQGFALWRLGLEQEAKASFDSVSRDLLEPNEVALLTSLRKERDFLHAHEALHHYLLTVDINSMWQREKVLVEAYPLKYGTELEAATKTYSWDPYVFLALVREESDFNPRIVSHAGARGLSQLMPTTGRNVARWLGISISDLDKLFDPALNLRIGARYLDYLFDYFSGNPYLAVPGYNAGEGNVKKWLSEGMRPTDEYVEEIPYRETRHYVKRVMSSYQVYRTLNGTGPLYLDGSAYNDAAIPQR